MWIFTESGFISAVLEDRTGEVLKVRARDTQSLEPLTARFGVEVVRTPSGDYPYRVFISRAQLADYLADAATAIDYGNFKGHVQATRGSRFVRALHRVWDVMHDVEDDGARSRE